MKGLFAGIFQHYNEIFMAIATLVIAYYGYKAIFSWKNELRQKSEADLVRRIYIKVAEMENYFYYCNINPTVDQEYISKLTSEFEAIAFDYNILNKRNAPDLAYFIHIKALFRRLFIDDTYNKKVVATIVNHEELDKFKDNVVKIKSFCNTTLCRYYKN